MDPQELSVTQLKRILKEYRLPITGRKNELITKLQNVDPTGNWIKEAIAIEDNSLELEEETVVMQNEDRIDQGNFEQNLRYREAELELREKEMMIKEIEMLKRENELLRRSTVSNNSINTNTTIDVKNVGKLLENYDGSEEDFKLWKSQINLLKESYKLTENATKLIKIER